MRISVVRGDPGHLNYLRLMKDQPKVTLDGAEITGKCVTADEEQGLVIVYKLDEKGKPKVDRKKMEIEVEELKGVVKIECQK